MCLYHHHQSFISRWEMRMGQWRRRLAELPCVFLRPARKYSRCILLILKHHRRSHCDSTQIIMIRQELRNKQISHSCILATIIYRIDNVRRLLTLTLMFWLLNQQLYNVGLPCCLMLPCYILPNPLWWLTSRVLGKFSSSTLVLNRKLVL